MSSLKLPITIRTAKREEVPQVSEDFDFEERASSAKIIEGYTIQYPQSNSLYKFSAEINVDTDRLFNLVKELVLNIQSETVALIYYHSDYDPKYGEYVDKYELINFLENYRYELVNDAFFEFGIIYNSVSVLEEVFVSKYKYIQYWGGNEQVFRETLTKYDLFEVCDLEFIDYYPVVRNILARYKSNITETLDLVKIFEKIYGDEQLFHE